MILPSRDIFLLFGTGLLRFMLSKANKCLQGDKITMWCSHDIHVAGDLFWFKQTDNSVPIAVIKLTYTESSMKTEPYLISDHTHGRLVMKIFHKNTSLTINDLTPSDSGFYFCGAAHYKVTFGNGTKLDVKETHIPSEDELKFEPTTPATKVSDESAAEECSRGIFFSLTLLFGCILFLVCVIPLIWGRIRELRRLKRNEVPEESAHPEEDQDDVSVEYSSVRFSSRQLKPCTAS